MDSWLQLEGPARAVVLFGVRLVGVDAENGRKLLLSITWILLVLALKWLFRRAARYFLAGKHGTRLVFWLRQGIGIAAIAVMLLGLASIWFNDPHRLATALGLFTAALAISMQRFMTAVAGYFVILRGKSFRVGDRIVMGGVRGDVIELRLTQTTIMEMGHPAPAGQDGSDPSVWVRSRQYTGRVVTVSNAQIFDEPVYNYTREFPYLWEEIAIPIPWDAERRRAEEILLEAARRHSLQFADLGETALAELRRRYVLSHADTFPAVYYRLTDNWLELTVRFIVEDHQTRKVKDAISRAILDGFEEHGIRVASQTFELARLPPLRVDTPPEDE